MKEGVLTRDTDSVGATASVTLFEGYGVEFNGFEWRASASLSNEGAVPVKCCKNLEDILEMYEIETQSNPRRVDHIDPGSCILVRFRSKRNVILKADEMYVQDVQISNPYYYQPVDYWKCHSVLFTDKRDEALRMTPSEACVRTEALCKGICELHILQIDEG